MAALHHPVDDLEHRRTVTDGEGVHDLVQQRGVRVAEQRGGHLVRHAALVGTREQLVHHRHRVTDRTRTRPHDQREHRVLDLDLLPAADVREVVAQRAGRDQTEGVVVGTGADRPDHLLRLRGREDELEVLRRLLHHLQQRVEAGRGDHVRLVQDEDLVPAVDRREERPLPQLTRIVHTTVRGGVDLDHVDRTRATRRQVAAGLALTARRGRGAFGTVQTARQDARTRRLAAATRATEQIGVVDPVVAQGLLERSGHVLLPDDLGESLGAIAAVQG